MDNNIEQRFNNIAVIGAAGKMGCGISLLLLQQMACRVAQKNGKAEKYKLMLIDANEEGVVPLKHYLKDQLKKFAERNINDLRKWYSDRADLVDNEEMIDAFIEGALDCVRFGSLLEECRGAKLVFEAIVEDVAIKGEMFAKLNDLLGKEAYYFSNTSSIPISILQDKGHLEGRLIGFHFYNPPAVQRLLEIIIPKNIEPDLKAIGLDIAKQMQKIVVFSNDIAGFIGNGHFIREIQFACEKVRELAQAMPLNNAIILVNRVTQEFLLRPMGTFQLLDYVGIDVAKRIAQIMTTYLPGNLFGDPLIDTMVEENALGGQFADGSQKDGFFHYEKGALVSIFDLKQKSYVSCLDAKFQKDCDNWLGPLPQEHISWKMLCKDEKRESKINHYFQQLLQTDTPGVGLAQAFLGKSRQIAQALVNDGIANSIGDVDTVLQNGFFHLYGVDVPFASISAKRGR